MGYAIDSRELEFFRCTCGSNEHQFMIEWDKDWHENDEEWREVWFEIHLVNYLSWWKRIKPAIKYLFGHKTRYGNFESIGMNKSQVERAIKALETAKIEVWSE